MIELVGFQTLHDKPRGEAGITRLRRKDRVRMGKPPSERWLRSYLKKRRYPITGSRCEPVYFYVAGK